MISMLGNYWLKFQVYTLLCSGRHVHVLEPVWNQQKQDGGSNQCMSVYTALVYHRAGKQMLTSKSK